MGGEFRLAHCSLLLTYMLVERGAIQYSAALRSCACAGTARVPFSPGAAVGSHKVGRLGTRAPGMGVVSCYPRGAAGGTSRPGGVLWVPGEALAAPTRWGPLLTRVELPPSYIHGYGPLPPVHAKLAPCIISYRRGGSTCGWRRTPKLWVPVKERPATSGGAAPALLAPRPAAAAAAAAPGPAPAGAALHGHAPAG